MAITAISYDWGVEPTMVRITTTDTLSTITTAGYWTDESVAVAALNNGAFTFPEGCLIAISYSGGQNTFSYDSATLTFIPVVGQYVESIVEAGSPLSLTTDVALNITSIDLPVGEWSVTGSVRIALSAATTSSDQRGGISTVSATLPTGGVWAWQDSADITGSAVTVLATPTQRLSLVVPTTIYLVAYSSFAVSGASCAGYIAATRVG